MPNRRRVITIQNVDDELWSKVQGFLQTHKKIPSASALGKASLENYLELAARYEIDKDWKVQVPKGNHDTIEAG